MQNAIILHGAPERKFYYDSSLPSESNAHWLPWLQKELLVRDIAAATPEIPHSYEPKWDTWTREIARYDMTPETILVGHSAGGGFWAKYLSQHPELRVGKVILVAPWLDPDGTLQEDFFAGSLDAQLPERTRELVIFASDDDSASVQKSVARLMRDIPGARLRQFHGYGHFTYDNLGGVEFPELLSEVLSA